MDSAKHNTSKHGMFSPRNRQPLRPQYKKLLKLQIRNKQFCVKMFRQTWIGVMVIFGSYQHAPSPAFIISTYRHSAKRALFIEKRFSILVDFCTSSSVNSCSKQFAFPNRERPSGDASKATPKQLCFSVLFVKYATCKKLLANAFEVHLY